MVAHWLQGMRIDCRDEGPAWCAIVPAVPGCVFLKCGSECLVALSRYSENLAYSLGCGWYQPDFGAFCEHGAAIREGLSPRSPFRYCICAPVNFFFL